MKHACSGIITTMCYRITSKPTTGQACKRVGYDMYFRVSIIANKQNN